jgi:predicted ATP-dependent endonuclease of OLD family
MEHINELRINRFRGLRDLKIEGLGQVNLFVGKNNTGKTSVLEACSLFCDPLNVSRWRDIGLQREPSASLPFHSVKSGMIHVGPFFR